MNFLIGKISSFIRLLKSDGLFSITDIKACFDTILNRKRKKSDAPWSCFPARRQITSGKRTKSELTAGRKVKLLLLLYLYEADIHVVLSI